MEKQVKVITRHLLNSGAFNHLPDGSLSRLHWLLLGHSNADTASQLMQYWYKGDYFSQGVPQYLLHNCNMLLIHAGKPAIDMLIETEMDA